MSLFGKIYESDLAPRTKLVYMNLVDRAGRKGSCFPSHKKIAADTSLSTSSVKRALAELIEQGYIVKEKRVRANMSDTSNLYTVLR